MEFLQAHAFQIGMVAAFVVVMLVMWRDVIGSGLKWMTTPSTPTKISGSHPRLEVLTKLDEAYDYFESEECPEGMEHVKAAIQHVYHEHKKQEAS